MPAARGVCTEACGTGSVYRGLRHGRAAGCRRPGANNVRVSPRLAGLSDPASMAACLEP